MRTSRETRQGTADAWKRPNVIALLRRVVLASETLHMDRVPEHALRPLRKRLVVGERGRVDRLRHPGGTRQRGRAGPPAIARRLGGAHAPLGRRAARRPRAQPWSRDPGTRALDTDRRFITLLDRLGFHRDDDHAVKMHRRLDIPIPGTMSSVRAKARPTSKVGVWVSARASTSPSWTRAERIRESPWHLRPSARMSAPGCTPSSSGWFRVIPEVVDEAATRERRAPSSRL